MGVGLPVVQFAIHTPTTDNAAHIRHALGLGLPEADDGGKQLHLYANGPSAREAPFPSDAATMAVNGALKLFREEGPDYWIACDPQALVADLLDNPPQSTLYLVASKCHPAVFERLQGRDVRLWHVNDLPVPGKQQVPCAVSATLCALMLAMRLGYRQIDVWGWDCCLQGEAHHAGPGELAENPEILDIEVGEGEDAQWFKSTATWCCEVEDALKILPVLKWAGVDVRIHGPSMIAAIANGYAHAEEESAARRAAA